MLFIEQLSHYFTLIMLDIIIDFINKCFIMEIDSKFLAFGTPFMN